MKSLILYIFTQLLFLCIFAQPKIKSYEYWFDNDYNNKIIINITLAETYILNTSINTSKLNVGLHTFNIHFADDSSQYSSVVSSYFYKSFSNVSGYEYWFDDNYSNKVSQSITSSETLNFSPSINVDALSPGYHTFSIRTKDAGNTWSTTQSAYFIQLGKSSIGEVITGYRYWFDNGRDTSEVKVPISTPASEIIITHGINANNLDTGYHWLYVQVKDTAQVWSSLINRRFKSVGKARLDNVTPDSCGNIGEVTFHIHGDGFYEGTSVKLALGTDTISIIDSNTVNVDGTMILAAANLRGKALGRYDVIVKVPNDTVMILPKAIKIIEGIKPDLYTAITGPSAYRIGSWEQYSINCRNDGNVNATATTVWLAIPEGVEYKMDFDIIYPNNTFNWDSIPIFFHSDTIYGHYGSFKIFPLIIPIMAPHETATISFKLRSNQGIPIVIKTWVSSPFYQSPINEQSVNCILDAIAAAVGFVPGYGCIYGWLDLGLRPIVNCVAFGDCKPTSRGNLIPAIMMATLNCIPGEAGLTAYIRTEKALRKTVSIGGGTANDPQCLGNLDPQKPLNTLVSNPVVSRDPNEKYGPIAFDTTNTNYISKDFPVTYSIHFENDSSATAPALKVVVVDTLKKSVYDVSTFQLGSITIADTTITIPPGLKNYTTYVDLSSKGIPYLCQLNAGINEVKGIVKWEFITLELSTWQAATGVTAGFLPPNVISPQGQASIDYSIKLHDTASLNTPVDNKAYIYFDYNQAIATGTWHNQVDNYKPHSKVTTLPSISDSVFTIQWHSVDTGAGLQAYNVYYALNNHPYQLLLSNTTSTYYEFHGLIDSTYSFFTLATDKAGNRETGKSMAEAFTTVKLFKRDSICPNGNVYFTGHDKTAGNSYQWEVSTGDSYSPVPGATYDTLRLQNIPSSFAGFKYRCRITNASVVKYSAEHELHFANKWKGTISTAWETAGNWSCGVIPDDNTDVIITTGTLYKPVLSSSKSCRSVSVEPEAALTVKPGFVLTLTGSTKN